MGVRRTVDVRALTEREREVARLMAKGQTNPQIAEDLGITLNTAKWHVSQVIAKLGVATREEAVAAWKVDQSATARFHRAIAVAATVGGLKIAGATGGVALVVGAGIAGISTIATSGNNLENGVIVAAVETPTPAPTPTATPSAREGCPGGPDTIRLPLEPCPPEDFPGLEDARASGVCDLSARDIAANLWNVDLRDCNLAGVNLASAAANNAHFDRADLKGADLHGGSFANASFDGANLAPAIFQGANLRGANLEGAIIRDTHFGGARWGNTVCPDGTNSDDPANGGTCIGAAGIVVVPYVFGGQTAARTPLTPFLATGLRAIDHGSCSFDGEDLAGLKLLRLNLPGCSFAGANLAGIEVRGTSLGGANLRGANIAGTRFRSVDLTDAILQGATGLPVFEYVKWENTICPDGSNSRVMDGDHQTCESNLLRVATAD
jgi:uncharacterized protein YjbI with pentapeptide repeats/DNA-binding CsgD family transcriptional regulator